VTTPALPSTWWRVANDPEDWFSADELDRARRYRRPLTRLRIAMAVVTVVVTAVVIFGEVPPRLVDALGVENWVAQLVVVVVLLEVLGLVLSVPGDAWVELGHDKRWELSTQTTRGFIGDQVKGLVLGLLLNVVLFLPLFAIIRSTDLWWLWGWLVVVVFSIGFGFVYPIVIAPIFNTFTPLEDGEVADRVDAVAETAAVTISGTYVADESRRSRRDNAYVAGLGATRRVVLFDTLLEHPPEVVEQVVAHEIGHWRLGHLRKQIPVLALLMLAVFLGLRALAEWDWLFDQAGIVSTGDFPRLGEPTALPILLSGVQIGFGAIGLVSAWVSRAFERQADLEALDLLGQPDVMVDMQRRLHVKNLADLEPSTIKRLQATHPPAAERMAFTTAWRDAVLATSGGEPR
jgi:STE24 endopeptidase